MKNNTENKHIYWIKLWEWFLKSDEIRILLRQKNGSLYIVLYLFLCLDTANYEGYFEKRIGNYVIPYDAKEIYSEYVRLFSHDNDFSYETVLYALDLYYKLGLTKIENNKMRITNYDKLVGSESESARRMRRLREKIRVLNEEQEKTSQCDAEMSQCDGDVTDIRKLDIRSYTILDSNNIIVEEEEKNKKKNTKENDISSFQMVRGHHFSAILFISDNQIERLYDKLTKQELDYFLPKMAELINSKYNFKCSHYEFLVKMVEKERGVLNG